MKKKPPLQSASARFGDLEDALKRLPVKSQLSILQALRAGNMRRVASEEGSDRNALAAAAAVLSFKRSSLGKRDSAQVDKWISDLLIRVANSEAAHKAWTAGEDLGIRKRSPADSATESGALRSRTSDVSRGASQLRPLRGGGPGLGKNR
jgi:hypothetical protein